MDLNLNQMITVGALGVFSIGAIVLTTVYNDSLDTDILSFLFNSSTTTEDTTDHATAATDHDPTDELTNEKNIYLEMIEVNEISKQIDDEEQPMELIVHSIEQNRLPSPPPSSSTTPRKSNNKTKKENGVTTSQKKTKRSNEELFNNITVID